MSFTRRQILGGLAGLVVVGVGAGGASRYWLGKMADEQAGHDYELIAAPLDVELVPGHPTEAWAFGPSAPGTELRVRQGEWLRVRFINHLPVATTIHWHGIRLLDRDHPRLASQADSFHPAVLRLIASTVKAAHAHGKWVGVCGALASESLAVPMLVGLGVDELSVSVPLIPTIKARVRELEYKACQSLAQHVLGLESAEQVRAALQPSQSVNVAQSLVLEN